MSESVVTDTGDKDPRHESREGRNVFGRIALFVRQVVSQLRLVVTPTRHEWIRLIGVVLAFVAVMMGLSFVLDLVFGWGVSKVFGA
ncbi:preprotein translocase subunit SecE [Demequina capsici]|uniref:Protein translocase subunit SecE n=1 Tax=Demequina capsici TaxID=3075620 RepID=A0AA96FBZ2_9MICO|nr:MULTISPECIES: preprotein translocase subunit SecE [unclassified Demequina]WNM24105.1 preprotein translocase subunit SecE [Demequina sp. OYTSA14]WNM26933.1 preprotein translocase subunit SecE [Demequina sp. PMTSA13]